MSKRMLVVVGALVVVAILFFVQNSKNGNAQSGGSGACQVQVTADVLNVRSGPGGQDKVVGKLTTGAVKQATTTVRNGYRELVKGQWASDQFLKPVSGSC